LRQAPSIYGSLQLCYWAKSSGHNRLSRLSTEGVEEGSNQLITVHSAVIFVFVGVDSNRFRYVRDFEVVVQGLVGDVPGGTTEHSEHLTGMFGGSWCWMACCIPVALSHMSLEGMDEKFLHQKMADVQFVIWNLNKISSAKGNEKLYSTSPRPDGVKAEQITPPLIPNIDSRRW